MASKNLKPAASEGFVKIGEFSLHPVKISALIALEQTGSPFLKGGEQDLKFRHVIEALYIFTRPGSMAMAEIRAGTFERKLNEFADGLNVSLIPIALPLIAKHITDAVTASTTDRKSKSQS